MIVVNPEAAVKKIPDGGKRDYIPLIGNSPVSKKIFIKIGAKKHFINKIFQTFFCLEKPITFFGNVYIKFFSWKLILLNLTVLEFILESLLLKAWAYISLTRTEPKPILRKGSDISLTLKNPMQTPPLFKG